MEKTEIKVGTDFFDFVCKIHQSMKDQQMYLVYEGEVNQGITKAFADITNRNLEENDEGKTTKKRVYHVMIECLQNIFKHADDPETGEPVEAGQGIFIVGQNNAFYRVTTGNFISNKRKEKIAGFIDHLNNLDKDGLKELYKKQIQEGQLSEKGGAGLGLIDIIKKTGNQIEYSITQKNDIVSFLVIICKINKDNPTV